MGCLHGFSTRDFVFRFNVQKLFTIPKRAFKTPDRSYTVLFKIFTLSRKTETFFIKKKKGLFFSYKKLTEENER